MPTFGEFETVGQPLTSSDERGHVTTVWKARHERSNSYMFIKPSLKEIAKELADEMIKYMPPQTKR